MAWADNRSGSFQIYAALHTATGWQQLAGSAQGGGISAMAGASRRPSLAVDSSSGNPIVAWTESNGSASDIQVAEYDPTANGGVGGWAALGSSLSAGGISGTGAADDAQLLDLPGGPVVAWLDSSGGTTNIYARQFVGGHWVALGKGADSGLGLSGSTGNVSRLALATDGTKIAASWTQSVAGIQQVFVKEFANGSWSGLAGSASGGGVSATVGDSQAPSIAYHNGSLFVAWQDNTSGNGQIDAAYFNGTAWLPAGTGISETTDQASQPKLAAADGQMYLSWIDGSPTTFIGTPAAVYIKKWNGTSFVEELPGDASYRLGISKTAGATQSPAMTVDNAGHPFVAWNDDASGSWQIDVRGNTFDLGTVYYVNDASSVSDAITTAPGSLFNSGLVPNQPKPSIQSVLNTYTMHDGDVILVDSGTYSDNFMIPAASANFLLLGVPNGLSTVNAAVTLDHTTGVVFENLNLDGGVTVTQSTNVLLNDDIVSGQGVIVNGGSAVELTANTILTSSAGITLTGGTSNADVEQNAISSGTQGVAVIGAGAQTLRILDNQFQHTATGIALTAAATGQIVDNDVSATATGLDIEAPFIGNIDDNDFHGDSVGIKYAAAAALSANRIYANATGVVSTVAGDTNGLGFVGTTEPNQIFSNATGVQLSGQMQGQHVYANVIGVSGSGILGGDDLDHANLIELNAAPLNFSGPIQFNRIARQAVGIAAQSGQLIAHNLIYGNTQMALEATGQTGVRIINNTFDNPLASNIVVSGGSSNVEVLNNILWTSSGYDIDVANDSQAGFFSDYNDLYADGTGKLVYWTKDFTDILDWQDDVDQFDLHSIGHTSVNPTWAEPRFFDRSLADYRLFDLAAGLRFSSPTIGAGDALSDEAQRPGYQNLLVNGGFESGLTGWSTNSSATVQTASPAPFSGSQEFFAGPTPVGFAEQSINLITAGFTAAQIDSLSLAAVFGGRVRSAAETPVDQGQITLTFLDQNGVEISHDTALAQNVSGRWELVGDRLQVPLGTRSIRFHFEATRESGSTADSFLDGAFLYVLDNHVTPPDQGAYGNTPVETQHAQQWPAFALQYPDLYTDWEKNAPHTIRWTTYGNADDSSVRIDLYQDGPNGAQFLANITPATPDTGQFIWIPADSGIDYGTHGLRIQVSLVGHPTVVDRSTEAFAVPENTNTFYVNDSSTAGDEYTTAAGSNRNTGKLPSEPKPYPNNVLRIYSLGPTQTMYVDTGNYTLLSPLKISNTVGIGDDEGFTISGPTGAGHVATVSLSNPLTVAPLVELTGADYITMSYLSLSKGEIGLWIHGNSTHFVGSYLSIDNSSQDGLRIESGSDGSTLDHIISSNNAGYGIYVDDSITSLGNSQAFNNHQTGIYLNNPGAVVAENDDVHNNQTGIYVSNSASGSPAVIGNSNPALGRGNRVYNNASTGITASTNVLVTGNIVYGQNSGSSGTGISLSAAQATQNVVYGNSDGIDASNSTVSNNRVYDNTAVGVNAADTNGNPFSVSGNTVYSNSVGIQANFYSAYYYYSGGTISNNLVYANTNQGLLIVGATSGYTNAITNNTVYQPVGDAIKLQNSPAVRLRNNILWVNAGYDLNVDTASQVGFDSDYNDLYITGARAGRPVAGDFAANTLRLAGYCLR